MSQGSCPEEPPGRGLAGAPRAKRSQGPWRRALLGRLPGSRRGEGAPSLSVHLSRKRVLRSGCWCSQHRADLGRHSPCPREASAATAAWLPAPWRPRQVPVSPARRWLLISPVRPGLYPDTTFLVPRSHAPALGGAPWPGPMPGLRTGISATPSRHIVVPIFLRTPRRLPPARS